MSRARLSIWLRLAIVVTAAALAASATPSANSAQQEPAAGAGQQEPAASTAPQDPIPLLAYYYIWFNATSWDRAKIDYPALGRYSSDEARIMRRHILLAKEAASTASS